MFPNLIDIGFVHLKTYGACMAIGFILCWTLIERLSGRKDLSSLLMSLMISGIVGSRIAYVIEHWQTEFAAHPASVIRVDQGGLMFYGGLILAILVFIAWCIFKKENPLKLADLLATVVPLGHACGRIGCFFYGCCYGKLSTSPLAIAFPRHSPAWYEQFQAGQISAAASAALPVLPTQLFEAAALLLLFTLLMVLRKRLVARPGSVVGAYLVGYAILRFAMEYLRGDPRAAVGPFSISQTISIFMILLGGGLLAYGQKRAHLHR